MSFWNVAVPLRPAPMRIGRRCHDRIRRAADGHSAREPRCSAQANDGAADKLLVRRVMTPLAKGTETEPIPACAKRLVYINSNLIMENRDNSALWRALTPVQRSLLARLDRDGPLLTLRPWEMRTVRSLLGRGLVRPRPPGRDGCAEAGLWILSAKGRRILPNRVHIADVSSPEPPWEGESAPSRAAGRQPRSGMGASPFGAPGTTGRAAP